MNNGHAMQPLPRPQLRPMAPESIRVPFTAPQDRPRTTGTNHLHWGITAYQSLAEDGLMRDSLTVEVEAPDEQAAWARAMEIVERAYYRTSWVRESCSLDPALGRA